MSTITIQNVDPRIDGEYDLVTVDDWSHDEWHRVKKLTGLVVGDFFNASDEQKFDADVLFAMALIALERAGKQRPDMLLKQAKLGDIVLPEEAALEEEGEGEDVPPVSAPPTLNGGEPSGPAVGGSSTPNSSEATSDISVSRENDQLPTGIQV